MKWTGAQRKVIEKRNSDILVSAAAGSGKTAVLVERIISLVCDKDEPLDIDRILVVTFTRAAAGEMKERIYSALLERIKKDPGNRHIARQLSLIVNAHISTIDGFCQYVVKNYFHETNLDPSIRVADEGELVLLKNEVMEGLLEERYKGGKEGFLALSDAFSVRDKDERLIEMVFDIHEKAASYPYPKEWIEGLWAPYEAEGEKEVLNSPWMRSLYSYLRMLFEGLYDESKKLYEYLTSSEEIHPYADAVMSDMRMLKELVSCSDYASMADKASDISFAKLSSKKIDGEDPDERKALKDRRDRIKKEVTDIKSKLLFKTLSEICSDMRLCRGFVKELCSLALDYENAYKLAKEKRGIMDFSDMEHFALDILIDPVTKERTDAAKALAKHYHQIMVDEYQDSNFLQEMILSAITREEDGCHDYFMVGDVKQSIYRFRQARPDIFIDKYDRFGEDDNNTTVIDLDKNFRSRREVTDSVNAVFASVMHKDLGGVEYDKRQELVCGADYYESFEGCDLTTEILTGDESTISELGLLDSNSLEALIIAQRIRELLVDGTVTDKITGKPRSVRLSDIAILHRSANTVGKKYLDVLKAYGIEALMVSSTGYFSAVEVETMLALLKVLNNPNQDIPLAAVMKSPIFIFTDEELAIIRAKNKEDSFWRAVKKTCEEQNEGTKLYEFWKKIKEWRRLAGKAAIYELLGRILRESGYLSYVSALPGGDVRSKNLKKLISLSIQYENTSYKGLFYFTRYIERLKKYEQDMGQARAVSGSDAVRIMTIHKSKGLEFPVVFVAGCGRRIMTRNNGMVLNAEYGIGIHAIDLERRIKRNTLTRSFLARIERTEDKGEELRILYVAMTRAKEKLIMTGVTKNYDRLMESAQASGGKLSYLNRFGAESYLELMMPAAVNNSKLFHIKRYMTEDLVLNEMALEAGAKERLLRLRADTQAVSSEDIKEVGEELGFVYPHRIRSDTKVKYSVSELKRSAMREAMDEADAKRLFEADEEGEAVPSFVSGEKTVKKGALKGTAVHRYLECFDFETEDLSGDYKRQLELMIEGKKLDREEAKLLGEDEIIRFLSGRLAERMKAAAKRKLLKKEAAFVMGDVPSHFIEDSDKEGEDVILVQGIIDVFFKEDDGIVLVDYKTDRIRSEGELVKRYKKQMELYADALERVFDMPVKERILYSFALGRCVNV